MSTAHNFIAFLERPATLALRIILLATLVALVAAVPGQAQFVPDPGTPDTLKVDSVVAYASGKGVVPVRFFNDETLASLEVVLRLQSPSSQIKVDSFSFVGGRVQLSGASNGFQLTQSNTVVTIFSVLGSETLPPGSGLLGNVYYSYPQSVPQQVYPIDSTSWIQVPSILHSLAFGTEDNELFKPQFERGFLDIQETPSTLDSLWIDSVGSSPGQPVALNVYAYNERAVAEVVLAFDYDQLLFDSVSFVGTRGASATNRTVQSQAGAHTLYVNIEFGNLNPLAAGSGPIATMHYHVAQTSPEQLIMIDTVVVGISSVTKFTLTDADGGAEYTPIFHPGYVNVEITTDVDDDVPLDALPIDFALSQNYPNPFNPTTTIDFALPRAADVTLDVFNVLGRRVRRLVDETLPAGNHSIEFDARNNSGEQLATGVYFYRIEAGSFVQTRKMLLLK